MERTLFARLTRPKHVLASLLVMVVLGGGLVVAVASTDVPVETPFVVPVPHEGDAGVYRLREAGLDDDARRRGFAEDRALTIAFAFGKGSYRYDDQGIVRWTHAVRLNVTDERGTDDRVLWLGPAGEVVATYAESVSPDEPRTDEGIIPGTTRNDTGATTWGALAFGGGSLLPCGLRDPLQGDAAPAPGEAVPYPSCMWGPHPLDPNRHHRVVLGFTDSEPRLLVVDHYRTHPADAPKPGDRPDWRAWYQEGVPYPIRMEDVVGAHFGAPGDVLELTGLVRGGTPLAPPSGDAPADLEPLRTAPLRPWLVEDGDAEHPWPLSAAYAYALHDPANRSLAGFMAEHPDAYVAQAGHAAFDMDGQHTERWSFTVTDGEARHFVTLAQDQGPAIGLLPGVGAGEAVSYRYGSPWTAPVDGKELPPRDALPDRMPSAGSLLRWWEAIMEGTGHPDASPSWGFLVSCAEDCGKVEVDLSAGQVYYHREGGTLYPVVDNRNDTWETSELWWRDGTVQQGGTSHQAHERTQEVPLLPASVPDEGPGATATDADLPAPPGWTWPTPAQAAGIGGIALLAGLLYWLSPLAKTAFLGLFSRVRQDALLDHPSRRAVFQAIEAQPGIHYRELLRVTGRSDGALQHHLGKLSQGGLVTAVDGPGHTCYFVKGTVDHGAMRAAPVLKSEGARRLLDAARAAPGASPAELARRAAMSPQTAHYHLHRLEEAGLLATTRADRHVSVRPTALAEQAGGFA